MRPNILAKHQQRKTQVSNRIKHQPGRLSERPMMTASNIHYELADRTQGISHGAIGAIHLLAKRIGLIDAINQQLHLLKLNQPYFESDHVVNIAYNLLVGGRCLEHLELLRNDEAYLDALGAQRIPDPTTAGDFCRRFAPNDVEILMDAINGVRLKVWKQQPRQFFDEAFLDADGTQIATDAGSKQGVDINYEGTWGYHPLVVSLANTQEPLYIVNRSGNRPSHENAHVYFDKAIDLCREAGFRKITLRGDTDFSQTEHLDRWNRQGDVRFIFGFDAHQKLVDLAENLAPDAYSELERPARYKVQTKCRSKRPKLKEQIVVEREYHTIRLQREDIAEIEYKPVACREAYRIIVLRKRLWVTKGQLRLFDEVRYFFYITNDWNLAPSEIVFLANDRCDQENLLAQLKGGVKALSTPVDTLVSNWAYMVMGSLAWSLKIWFAMLIPVEGPDEKTQMSEKNKLLRMEFATFRSAVMALPCQIVRSGRKLIYRFLSWSPWQLPLLRLVERLHCCRLC